LGGSNIVNSTSTGVVNPKGNSNGGGDSRDVGFQPLPGVRFGGNDRGQPFNGTTGNGNGNNGDGGRTTLQPSGSGNSRPSAGGFSFPPSVNRSGIGSKRPAESMLQRPQRELGGSGFKRVSTGMGLTTNRNGHNDNGNTNASVKREPLGSLFVVGEDGEGGGADPKRMRR